MVLRSNFDPIDYGLTDGKTTTAKELLMQCFEFESTAHRLRYIISYQREVEEAQKRLETLRNMTLEEAEKKVEEEYQRRLQSIEDNRKRYKELFKLHEKLMKEVMDWTPPTPRHQGLKDDAIMKLNFIGVDPHFWDDEKPAKEPAKKWLDEQIARCIDTINKHKEKAEREKKEIEAWNKYKSEFLESLANM